MRDLSTLHASMAAATKARSSRRPAQPKPIDIRPGTSTGYEGGEWHIQTPTSATATTAPDTGSGNHSFRSFRDSIQSFPAPQHRQSFPAPGQSFRDPSIAYAAYSQSPFSSGNHGSTNGNGGNSPPLNLPAPSASRPGTSGERLPPLASLLPLPQPGLLFRRPHTAGSSLAGLPLSIQYPSHQPRPGTSGGLGGIPPAAADSESPFSFHVPPGPGQEGGGGADSSIVDGGSESRPQSRRLSVLELCNDPGADVPSAAGGVLAGGSA